MNKAPDNAVLRDIRRNYGLQAARLLERNEVIIQKDRFGSYNLPENFIPHRLDPRMIPIKTKKSFKSRGTIERKHPKITANDLDYEDNFHLFDNFRRSLSLSTNRAPAPTPGPSTSDNKSPQAWALLSALETKEISEIIKRNLNSREPTKEKKTIRHSKGDEIFKNIIDPVSPEYFRCSFEFFPIMKTFAKKHKQFQYQIYLDSIPQDKTVSDGQLSQNQLFEFFSKILYRVVPDQLFGSRRNNVKIKTTIKRYLKAGSENFTLESLLLGFNVEAVTWLQKINFHRNKVYVLSQVLHWFFDKFLWNIIYTYLYEETIQPGNYEKIFFRRWVKKKNMKEFVIDKVNQNIYIPASSNEVRKIKPIPMVPQLRLFSKVTRLRPVVINKTNPDLKKECKQFLQVLKRLHWLDNPPKKSRFTQKVWETMVECRKKNPHKPLYFICCDIRDAFGSIDQGKMQELVFNLMANLPKTLESRSIAIIKPVKGRVRNYLVEPCIGFDVLPPFVPPGSLYCVKNGPKNNLAIVDKERMKKVISDNILRQVIQFEKKYYFVKQGVGQGLPMSAILNEIYYHDMETEVFGQFVKSGHLFRFVDDFLYLTDNKELAEKFLEITRNGVRSYNCTFKEEKTKSNLQPYNQKEFSFLGFRYNVETLDVKPEYNNIPVRYAIKLSEDPAQSHNLFIRQLSRHLEWLKLYPFVLDPRVNSKETVLNTLRTAARMSAEKCCFLIINLYDYKNFDRKQEIKIFQDIKRKAIRSLLRICYKSLKLRGRLYEIKFAELKSIIWFEYLKMFKKNSILCKKFNGLIKRQFDPKFLI